MVDAIAEEDHSIRGCRLASELAIANVANRYSRRGISDPQRTGGVMLNGVDFERIAEARGDRRELFLGLASNAKLMINVANMNSVVKGSPF